MDGWMDGWMDGLKMKGCMQWNPVEDSERTAHQLVFQLVQHTHESKNDGLTSHRCQFDVNSTSSARLGGGTSNT